MLKTPLRAFLRTEDYAAFGFAPDESFFIIENILQPHVAHTPFIALPPFFIVTCSVFFISRDVLHLIQCPCIYVG